MSYPLLELASVAPAMKSPKIGLTSSFWLLRDRT